MKKDCPSCLGTGKVPDHACIGASLRELRTKSLRAAAGDMGVSASHLCLLEAGKRRWTPDLVKRYRKACK